MRVETGPDGAAERLLPASEEVYVSATERRLALFALRYTVPTALITALIFATIDYLLSAHQGDFSISWTGTDAVSFLRVYLPSAFILPLMQCPLVLRRTLAARVAGQLQPALPNLKRVPWLQWSLALGNVAGGVWVAIIMTFVTIFSGWLPNVVIGEWEGLIIRLALTAVIAISVAILCAIAAVRIEPGRGVIDIVLDDGPEDGGAAPPVDTLEPAPVSPPSVPVVQPDQSIVRGRAEVPTGPSRGVRWDRWRVGVRQEVLQRAEGAVYFTAAQRYAFLRRFFVLLTLSVLMAVLGLYTNSIATVIAAMLIAPLGTPIMGLTLALVRGRPQRQLEALAIIASAAGYTFILAWVTGVLLPTEPVLPDVLVDFTDPKLADLIIALLAGAVGVYILVHTEASAALPGVAVALSLEAPIAASGLTFAWGRDDLANGAYLMFVVNLAAIVAAGSLVLIASGFLPVNQFGDLPRRVKVGLVMAVAGVCILAYPLYRVSSDIWQTSSEREVVGKVTAGWTEGTDLDLFNVVIDDDAVTLDLVGSDQAPAVEDLADDLSAELGRPVTVSVRVFPYTVLEDSPAP
jgi:uncharacterized hydrophobic protein (TIGR00271 family)